MRGGCEYVRPIMKKIVATAICFSVILCSLVGQAKYSGIYSGSVSGNGYASQKFLAAATAGGRIIALTDYSNGIYETLNPAKSTVSASGKVTGVSPYGTSVSANINSSFQINGTVKADGMTFRLSGRRTYK